MGSIRILAPVGLFAAFAFAHYLSTQTGLETIELTVAKEDVKEGAVLNEKLLGSIKVQGTAQLFQTFVPYGDRGKDLLFAKTGRRIEAGQLITLADLAERRAIDLQLRKGYEAVSVPFDRIPLLPALVRVGTMLRFHLEKTNRDGKQGKIESIGPFEVVSVGTRIDPRANSDDPGALREGRVLMLAVKRASDGTLNPEVVRILLASQQDPNRPEQIASVSIVPDDER